MRALMVVRVVQCWAQCPYLGFPSVLDLNQGQNKHSVSVSFLKKRITEFVYWCNPAWIMLQQVALPYASKRLLSNPNPTLRPCHVRCHNIQWSIQLSENLLNFLSLPFHLLWKNTNQKYPDNKNRPQMHTLRQSLNQAKLPTWHGNALFSILFGETEFWYKLCTGSFTMLAVAIENPTSGVSY